MISLVTGVGKRGQVGETVAAELARRGDIVLLVARSQADAAERVQDLADAGLTARGYACDLASPAEVDAVRDRIAKEHGPRLDVLVHLAGGFASSGPLAASDPAVWLRVLEINLTTAALATRSFLPMLASARGSIVYFASEAVLEGTHTAGIAAYAAAKAGVVALMRSVADEGRKSGVRANALAPSAIRTGSNERTMSASTAYLERGDVAAVVTYLSSPAAQAVSGQLIRLLAPAPGAP